jgi:hypothetical protein
MRIGGLNRFKDSQQRSGTALVLRNGLGDQLPFVSIQNFIRDTLHHSSSSGTASPAGRCVDRWAQNSCFCLGIVGESPTASSGMAELRGREPDLPRFLDTISGEERG